MEDNEDDGQPRSMTSLINLPEEILPKMMGHLDKDTLRTLATLCRGLQDRAEYHLWSSTEGSPYKKMRTSWTPPFALERAVSDFAWRLRNRPVRAKFVKWLYLSWHCRHSDLNDFPSIGITPTQHPSGLDTGGLGPADSRRLEQWLTVLTAEIPTLPACRRVTIFVSTIFGLWEYLEQLFCRIAPDISFLELDVDLFHQSADGLIIRPILLNHIQDLQCDVYYEEVYDIVYSLVSGSDSLHTLSVFAEMPDYGWEPTTASRLARIEKLVYRDGLHTIHVDEEVYRRLDSKKLSQINRLGLTWYAERRREREIQHFKFPSLPHLKQLEYAIRIRPEDMEELRDDDEDRYLGEFGWQAIRLLPLNGNSFLRAVDQNPELETVSFDVGEFYYRIRIRTYVRHGQEAFVHLKLDGGLEHADHGRGSDEDLHADRHYFAYRREEVPYIWAQRVDEVSKMDVECDEPGRELSMAEEGWRILEDW